MPYTWMGMFVMRVMIPRGIIAPGRAMTISGIDWAIVAAYFLLSAGIGLYFARRGGESLDQYFLSGRQAPWWLAGTAMVATTFAADTPLVVTGLVASKGVAGNWLWWNFVMSGMLTVFFFARLWRRAEVMTDVELAELRYSGRPAAFLRGFRALYLALPINLIILGRVTRAMIKILTIALGLKDVTIAGVTVSGEVVAVGICCAIAALYSVAAGMWAVLWTDLVQFVIKMSAVIVLAVYAVAAVGGIAEMKTKLVQHFGSEEAALSVLPVSVTQSGIHSYAWMPLLTLAVYLSVQWWAAWYPGAEPGGGGYVAQRIFSARSERDGVLATRFFQIAHYALRPWPWIVTGLATVILYPTLADKEAGYVQAFVDLLPTPWRGFMMAGFAAAYMSTVATHLNWGASYLVNDFYKRFLKTDGDQRHYVAKSRAATVLLFLASIAVTSQLASIEKAWELLLALGAGTGLVLILRWYWWRINAWSEISAMIASFVISLLGFAFIVPRFRPNDPNATAVVMLVTVAGSTIVWVVTTFSTAPEPDRILQSFYRRVRPGGPGWARVSQRLRDRREPVPRGAPAGAEWIARNVARLAALFRVGKIVFGFTGAGLVMLAIAAAAVVRVSRSLTN